MAGPKGTAQLTCCTFCGRDTRAQDGVCGRCSGRSNKFATDEFKGRKARSTIILGGNVIEDVDFEDGPFEPSTIETYHGPTTRDDL